MGDVLEISQINPVTRRTDASELALAVYEQFLLLLGQLQAPQWQAATECPGWSVADMVGHVIGAARAGASLPRMLGDQLYGYRHRARFGGSSLDAVNDRQVRQHAHLEPVARIALLREVVPRAVSGRRRVSPALRPFSFPIDKGGSTASGMPSRVNGAHLYDVVYTRDAWMHAMDISRATGRQADMSAPCHRRVIEDVVREWADRHRQPFQLVLGGPAGGHYRRGEGGPVIELDAVEFARILSGRAEAPGLLATRVLF